MMTQWSFSFITGSLFSLFLPQVPEEDSILFLLFFALALLCTRFRLFAVGILGFVWFQGHIIEQLSWQLPSTLIAKPASFVGQITQRDVFDNQLRLDIQLTSLNDIPIERWRPPKVRLYYKLETPTKSEQFHQGDTLRGILRLKPVRGLLNQHGTNMRLRYFRAHIVATGSLKEIQQHTHTCSVIERQKLEFTHKVQQLLSQQTSASTLRAILLAQRQGLSEAQREQLMKTGTSHLFAISGLHIGILFFFISSLCRWCISPMCFLFRSDKSIVIARSIALMTCCFYVWMIDMPMSAIRALVMLAVWLIIFHGIGTCSKRALLLLTCMVILLFDPFCFLDIGFWLSFGCVSVIFLITSLYQQKPGIAGAFRQIVILQIGLTCVMLPLSVVFFQGASGVSLFVNFIAVPLFSMFLMPLFVLQLGLLSMDINTLSGLVDWLCEGAWAGLKFAATFSWSWLPISHADLCCLLFLFICIATGHFFFQRWQKIAILLIGITPLLLMSVHGEKRQAELHMIDVGQGLSLVVLTASGKVLVYDTGPAYPGGYIAARYSLIPFLHARGIRHIDRLYLSHRDRDHIGGYETLARLFSIDEVIRGPSFGKENGCSPKQIQWAGIELTHIWPRHSRVDNKNDSSCVVMLEIAGKRILFPGDISQAVEQQIESRLSSVDILIAPHHGSRTSSSRQFLEAIRPKVILVSAGANHVYRHPANEVTARYDKLGIPWLNTGDVGHIQVSFSEEKWHLSNYRGDFSFFWFQKL
ncbi:DNA internalization-related competence protein ComEC/Rec2 [Algicola sagamiensis]|uniref:DNA internalization-related competence protein ComEC/Rec2 n=1 Tax=Algicola sagamiensis TaxID=163869 RepID=UPI00036F31A3|nr:DNA internalization-related competence protein ComEC/Rec2 [Algicola sagamiensis]